MTLLKHLWKGERTRHALIAAMVASLLGAIEFFSPLKPLMWTAQAQIAPRSASQDIIYVETDDDPSDPTNPKARRELAALVNSLHEAGAYKIFIDIIVDRPSTADADSALRQAIAWSDRTFLTQNYVITSTGDRVRATLPEIAGSAPQTIIKEWVDAFGYVWTEPYSDVVDGTLLPSLPAAIAERRGRAHDEFPIDYSIDHTTIPTFTSEDTKAALSAGRGAELFGDKSVVIGKPTTRSYFQSIPGHSRVPPSIVAILAAETLKVGPPAVIGWFPLLLATIAALLLATIISSSTRRRWLGPFAISVLIFVSFFASAHLRLAIDLATPIAFLTIFVALRLWHLRQRRALRVDGLSGLPSFRQLEEDLANRGSRQFPAVVIAKVHRFDEVLASLPSEQHGEYVRLVAERLRITDDELLVYSNGGRYLAWLQEVSDEDQLRAHLTGMRAMFAHPLHVAATTVDVGITFGADATSERDAGRKVAAAASAAERTTEAHSPVLLAQESSEADRLWNISVQAKIDSALESGEIYVVYQPQFDVASGALIGAEALVRWNDPERGHIAPSYFIEQCEQAGRMDALTRKVFQEAVESVSSSPLSGADFQLSINVSATLLHDLRLVDILRQVMSRSTLPASRLTVEITETSRISDYDTARVVMDQLRELGVRLSIDDFGVGAASLETLLLLPFDELKIDRIFVSRVRESAKAQNIVASLVQLGRRLNLLVIAEGVEDAPTLEILRAVQCNGAQGYFLGRPERLELLVEHAVKNRPRDQEPAVR